MTNTEISSLIKSIKSIEVSAHFAHLVTTSYAYHVALGGFYHDLLDAGDSLVEAWQGSNSETISVPTELSITSYSGFNSALSSFCEEVSGYISREKDLAIQDKLLDIQNICYELKYKQRLK